MRFNKVRAFVESQLCLSVSPQAGSSEIFNILITFFYIIHKRDLHRFRSKIRQRNAF